MLSVYECREKNVKYLIGIKEIIAVTVGSFLFLQLDIVQQIALPKLFGVVGIDHINFPIMFIAIVAAMFGPAVGAITGLGGPMLADAVMTQPVNYPVALATCIFGFLIGRYADKFDVLLGRFEKTAILDFTVAHILAGGVAWVMFLPIVRFIDERNNLFADITDGISAFCSGEITTVILGTPILLLVSYIRERVLTKRNNINIRGYFNG